MVIVTAARPRSINVLNHPIRRAAYLKLNSMKTVLAVVTFFLPDRWPANWPNCGIQKSETNIQPADTLDCRSELVDVRRAESWGTTHLGEAKIIQQFAQGRDETAYP